MHSCPLSIPAWGPASSVLPSFAGGRELSHQRPHCSHNMLQRNDAQPLAICIPLPVASPCPPQPLHIPFWEHWPRGATPPRQTADPLLGRFQFPTQEEASGFGAAVSAHHTSRASSYLLKRTKKKKKIPLSHTIIIFFSPVSDTKLLSPAPCFSPATAPAMPTGGSAELPSPQRTSPPHAHSGARSGGGGRGVT